MAKLIYDPGASQPVKFQDVAGTFASFIANPIITTIFGFFSSIGRSSNYRGEYFEADSETGKVTSRRDKFRDLPQGIKNRTIQRQHEHQQALLQESFDRGIAATGIEAYYRPYAEALAQFRIDIDRAAEVEAAPGFTPTPTINPPGHDEQLPEFPELPEPPDFIDPGPDPDDPYPFSTQVIAGRIHTPINIEDYFMPRFAQPFRNSIPGGASGFNQQTTAGKMLLLGRHAKNGTTTRRRRRPAKVAAAPRRRRAVKASSGKYNSAAWMAKIRKMRKRGK